MPHLVHARLLDDRVPPTQRDLLRRMVDLAERAGGEADLAELEAEHEALRGLALRHLPPHPGHVAPDEAVDAFCVGAWMLLHYERTVLGDRELIDTVGSRTLAAFRSDLEAGPEAERRLADALRRAFHLSSEHEARIAARLAPELAELDLRHRLVEALDDHFGLEPGAPDLPERVVALFGALYRGQPLRAGDVRLVRTGTSLFFVVPAEVSALTNPSEAHAQRLQGFLDRLHSYDDRQLSHFPVFGPFRGEGVRPALLAHLASAVDVPQAVVAHTLTSMVTTLKHERVDAYLWHDLWGHQWQSHLLPYEDDFRRMAGLSTMPDVAEPHEHADGPVTLVGCVGDALEALATGKPLPVDALDDWLSAVAAERLAVVASGMVSEVLADVVEYKFLVLAPHSAASMPSSSRFKRQPTKLDLVVADLRSFHQIALGGLAALAETPRVGGDALAAALAAALPAADPSQLDAVVDALRDRARTLLAGPLSDQLAPAADGSVTALARMALNLLAVCATLDDAYRRLEDVGDPYPAPLRDFRDLMVLSAGAFHQADPGRAFWHLDEYLGLHFEGLLARFVAALRAV